jgi:predicted nucleotidyltransferase
MNKARAYEIIRDYFAGKPVSKVMVFGSYARNEQLDTSDIDIIIKPKQAVGLLALAGFRQELSALLKIRVDLSTEKGISSYVMPLIKNEIETVYEQ